MPIKFRGDKPEVNDIVEITPTGAVQKWEPGSEYSCIIGRRVKDTDNLLTNQIMVMLISRVTDPKDCIITHKNPLFTARVDQQGRISILKRFRDKVGIKTGDLVDVFHMKKVEQ